MGYEVVNAVEHLEKAKDELYSLKIESEKTDDDLFVSKPVEGEQE